jgi:hypothetical protein
VEEMGHWTSLRSSFRIRRHSLSLIQDKQVKVLIIKFRLMSMHSAVF